MPAAAESVCVARDVQLAQLDRSAVAHCAFVGERFARSGALGETAGTESDLRSHAASFHADRRRRAVRFALQDESAAGCARRSRCADRRTGRRHRRCIATDHAPHEPALKDVEFDRAPFGILGFETAIGLSLEQLVHPGRISLMRMVELFTTGPARVLGMERTLAAGQPADVTIFSTDRKWTYDVKNSPSKSRNSPFDRREFQRRADGDDCGRQSRLEAVVQLAERSQRCPSPSHHFSL